MRSAKWQELFGNFGKIILVFATAYGEIYIYVYTYVYIIYDGYEIEKSSKIKQRKFFNTVLRKIILNYEVVFLLHFF